MKLKQLVFLCSTIAYLFIACRQAQRQEVYSGYSAGEHGIYFHRFNIGEGKSYPQQGDFLEFKVDFYGSDGRLIKIRPFAQDGGLDTLHFEEDKLPYGIYAALALLSEGDSCSFWVPAAHCIDTAQFYGWNPNTFADSMVRLEMKMLRIVSIEEQEAERIALEKFQSELMADEDRLLELFLDTCKQAYPKQADANGLYYYFEQHGSGRKANNGDLLTIRYKGSFLNGEVFDASTFEKEPLNFRLGEPGQVVRGIELALHEMRQGDRIQLLVPSKLAFGSKGSGAGIVGPFKTVTFALEILKIN